MNGWPTKCVGSAHSEAHDPGCGQEACKQLQETNGTWANMYAEDKSWSEMQNLECSVCKKDRQSKHLVLDENQDPRLQNEPFLSAPAIYQHNDPKYYIDEFRAQEFARTRNLCINWVVARDTPRHKDDQALSQEALNKKRLQWLSRDDAKTGGMMSLLPLIKGLPIRMTETVDRAFGVVKHRAGIILGWILHEDHIISNNSE